MKVFVEDNIHIEVQEYIQEVKVVCCTKSTHSVTITKYCATFKLMTFGHGPNCLQCKELEQRARDKMQEV
jgi:hypothetical protein